MITGINKVYQHDGRDLHIQAEDLGTDTAAFEVRVYDKGSVIWLKRIEYDDLVAEGLSKKELETRLYAKMEKLVHTVEAAIAKGKLDA